MARQLEDNCMIRAVNIFQFFNDIRFLSFQSLVSRKNKSPNLCSELVEISRGISSLIYQSPKKQHGSDSWKVARQREGNQLTRIGRVEAWQRYRLLVSMRPRS